VKRHNISLAGTLHHKAKSLNLWMAALYLSHLFGPHEQSFDLRCLVNAALPAAQPRPL
jgi:hypothetical protein